MARGLNLADIGATEDAPRNPSLPSIDTFETLRAFAVTPSLHSRRRGADPLDVLHKKGKGPSTKVLGPSCMRSLAVTYSGMACSHTTIGAGRFHFRVRNGIGWFPLAIAARQTGKLFVRRLSRSLMLRTEVLENQLRCIILSATNALRLYGQVSRAISTG
jgi:hypothetical protein